MKNLILIIALLSIGLFSCKKEEIKPERIKYKHPVSPDKINDGIPTLVIKK